MFAKAPRIRKPRGAFRYGRTHKFISSLPLFWRAVGSIPWLARRVNALFINSVANSSPPRPHAYSLWSPRRDLLSADYISWPGLTDRTYTGRHLPPAEPTYLARLPSLTSLAPLFQRADPMLRCNKSSALFGLFAQWLTDSFLRTDPGDSRCNTSNHELDLCQVYGLTAADTRILRTSSTGKLKSQTLSGEEYPPFLFTEDGQAVRDEFLSLSYVDRTTKTYKDPQVLRLLKDPPLSDPLRRAQFFATGLERGNSTIVYSAINTIFLREHNRLCEAIAETHPSWDNDRLFETARNANIAQYLRIIIEDYIAHLSPAHFKFTVDVGFAERQPWYRTNRICAEFNLLYRWHQLVPNELALGSRSLGSDEFRFNNEALIAAGIAAVLAGAASVPAGKLALRNTASFLVPADLAAIEKARHWGIRSFNEYRKHFRLPRASSIEDLTDDDDVADLLHKLYKGNVDDIELVVGLLAEARDQCDVVGSLMRIMVGVDAFSQALTNPLLSANVFGAKAFSAVGLESVLTTHTLDQVVQRNTPPEKRFPPGKVSFTLAKPVPGSYGPPLLGALVDTIDFFLVSGWEKFFRNRQARYKSTVFRINLFQPTIAILDHTAIATLFDSATLIQDYGFSWAVPARELVGNVTPSIFRSGTAHSDPKAFYLSHLSDSAPLLTASFDRLVDSYFKRWAERRSFAFRDQLEDFAMTLVCDWLLGVQADAGKLRFLYNNIFSHLLPRISSWLPWSKLSRSIPIYEDFLAQIRGSPRFPRINELARLQNLNSPDDVAKQLAFLVGMNSFLGLQSLLKSLVGELTRQPLSRKEIAAEIRQARSAELNGAAFDAGALPLLDQFLREILRLHPPVFFIFGRSTIDQVVQSTSGWFQVAEGELVMGVVPLVQTDPAVFPEGDVFRPGRFANQGHDAHLIWARGPHNMTATPTDRTCPGKDVALVIAKKFCVSLIESAEWQLENANVSWSRRRFSLNVAAPCGDLRVINFRRLPA